ncbi:hypothetical protein J2X20_005477 [Pelomonas saccharophila]|uniref:NTF2-like N-terminal transpeptidase domain-containing protein n=1 Tax=Roseateles saccharophilus TaxID=304 RepID=A0ABU1YVA8_ROSSA|nr:hypothetical protein [Roseateles saccharophilus]MDR7272794.1 hypothetical protein [Roseateles saccharophilus]
MKHLAPAASRGLFSTLVIALGFVAASALVLRAEASTTTSACDDKASLQRQLEDFDSRWNASDAWGLTAQFTIDGSLGAGADTGRLAVYRELIDRLGRSPQPRKTRLLRATPVGSVCLVDVQVKSGERGEPGLFLIAPATEGGIVAMR